MANTTNFGWETPDDTDLVKDGAAAMRTLGNSIDASFVDLKGGTTGQILSKNSNTDLDYVWINNDQGDITEVAAGVGISGGGTSGAVTITNSMATAIDAKGDLVAGTGADAFARLAVGANNTVLTADSSTATGLKWAAASAASAVGVQVFRTTTQTISTSTNTAISWSSDDSDTDGFWVVGSPTRLTIPTGKGGKYFIHASLTMNNVAGQFEIKFYKNGSAITNSLNYAATNASNVAGGTNGLFLTLAAADYLEVVIFSTGATQIVGTATQASLFYLGA